MTEAVAGSYRILGLGFVGTPPAGMSPWLWWGGVFFWGTIIGSFLNVCIARWPMELSVVAPRSRCPRCQRPIAWYENIPLLSWLALRARCPGCRLPISVQYPAVELGIAVGWVVAFAHLPVIVHGGAGGGVRDGSRRCRDHRSAVLHDPRRVHGLRPVVGVRHILHRACSSARLRPGSRCRTTR